METASNQPPGQPRHKPNPRHTLEEVLRSLQDMVRNELGDGSQHEPSRRDSPPGPARTDAVASSQEIEAGLRTLLDTLEGGIAAPPPGGPRAEAAAPPRPAAGMATTARREPPEPKPAAPAEFALEPSPPPAAPPPRAPEPPASPAAEPPSPAVSQHQLPLAEPAPEERVMIPAAELPDEARTAPAPEEAQLIDTDAAEEIEYARPEPEPAPELAEVEWPPDIAPESAAPDEERPAHAELDEDDTGVQLIDTGPEREEWGEIPVLEDAVFVPPEPEAPQPEPQAGELPAAAPVQLEVPLPAAEGARDVAIRVAARLNVELKRSGKRGLSNEVILRLTQILRESLAQAGTNMDNTGRHDKP